MATGSTSSDTLFFIPDIGGFTRFVSETEVSHSQHIVKELLELLVDANQLGMKVSEFEGDAVLFTRVGSPPSLADLLSQARRMYVEFHAHLKGFEMLRICQCGACAGASRITLKFVAHCGPAATMDVKGQSKFIGKSVIVAHRLLKNSVPQPEYLLVTQETLEQLGEGDAPRFEAGSASYDEIGEVRYRYRSMAEYLVEAKAMPPAPFKLEHPVRVMQLSRTINAPPSEVYQRLIDLPARMQWIDGIKGLEFRDESPNQIGKRHRCVRGGDDPEVVTSDVKVSPTSMEFWETDVKKMGAARYLVEPAPAGGTQLTLEFYLRNNLLLRLAFKLLMLRKMEPAFRRSLDKLAATLERAQAVH
jgi:hypothetical protein